MLDENDPINFPIKQKLMFGLWPPSKDTIADGIYTYIKKMPGGKVNILNVYDDKIEMTIRLRELDEEKKIENIEVIPKDDINNVAENNIREFNPNAKVRKEPGRKEYDVVIINGVEKKSDLIAAMRSYYPLLKTGGIFCGDHHHTVQVKEALGEFRRESKIGTPILVSNRLCWFWIKREK